MYFDLNTVTSDRQGRISLPGTLFKTGPINRGGTVCLFPVGDYWMGCDPARLQAIVLEEFPGSALDEDVRAMRRSLMIQVKSLHVDPQGRIQFKSIDGSSPGTDYVIVGVGQEFEIWPATVWQQHNEVMGGEDEV